MHAALTTLPAIGSGAASLAQPNGRCVITAVDAASHPDEYMAVQREAFGTPSAGRPVYDHDKEQVTMPIINLLLVPPVSICMYVAVFMPE